MPKPSRRRWSPRRCAAVLELWRARAARPQVEEEVALEEEPRPDIDLGVRVDRLALLVNREGHLGGVAGRLHLGDLTDVHAFAGSDRQGMAITLTHQPLRHGRRREQWNIPGQGVEGIEGQVIGVRVRQCVGVDRVALDLTQDPPAGVAAGRVHQHVAHQVDVERVRREAGKQPEGEQPAGVQPARAATTTT